MEKLDLISPYPHDDEAPADFVPKPEPAFSEVEAGETLVATSENSVAASQVVISKGQQKEGQRVDVATVVTGSIFGIIFGGLVAVGVTGAIMAMNNTNAASEKLPALAHADGFLNAHPTSSFLSTAPIELQATPTCAIGDVDIVTVDHTGKASWGSEIVDITQYSITNSPERGPMTTDTFHNFDEFVTSGLKAKYCS